MRLTLQKKIFFYTAVLVAATIAIIFFNMDRRIETDLTRFAEENLIKTRAVFRELEETRFQRLISLTQVIAEVPTLKAVVATEDPATVLKAAVSYQKTARSDLFIVTDRAGLVLARTDNPSRHGESLRDNPQVAKALKGDVAVGTLLHGGDLYQIVAAPLSIRGQFRGTIVLGFRVDDPLATELNRMTGTEVAFLLGARILATSLPDAQKTALDRFLKERLAQGAKPFTELAGQKPYPFSLAGEPYLLLVAKVTKSAIGIPVVLAIMNSLRPSLAVRKSLGRNLFSVGLVFLSLALGAAFLLSRTSTRSLRSLLQGTQRVTAGDLNQPIHAGSLDEIGELAESFNQMMERLKERTKELRGSEEKYRTLFEEATDGIRIFDEAGRIIDCNQTACDQLGYSREELLQKRLVEIVSPERIAEIRAPEHQDPIRFHIKQLMGRELEQPFESVELMKDGTRIPIEITAGLIKLEGEKRLITFVRDISERKRAEEDQRQLEGQIQHAQKLESLGILAGGIAHDFNNILLSIVGNTDLSLSELPPESPIRNNIEQIEVACRRLSGLTGQMLAYSGKGQLVIQPLNLSELVEEVANLLKTVVSKKITTKFELSDSLPAIEADASQLHQVVMNLITNASEAIGDKTGVVTVGTKVFQADRNYLLGCYPRGELREGLFVCLEVSDTGNGMNEETKAKIFDPFFTTKFTGRGLGLSPFVVNG